MIKLFSHHRMSVGGVSVDINSLIGEEYFLSKSWQPFCLSGEKIDFKKKEIFYYYSQKEINTLSRSEIIYSCSGVTIFTGKSKRITAERRSGDGNILWQIDIDSEFSRFECSLSQEAFQVSDFFQLTFNRFLLQHTFINHHGLIIHAAGGSINGKGMVFPAISGTGKSTLSHLLLPFPENQLFSEERIIMRRLDDGWHLWGTPWKGTGVIARNESAPLNAIVFLSQAPETKVSKLPPSAALRRLLETVSIPWYSQEWTDKGLAVCESLLKTIPVYELAFRPDQTAVQAVAELAASLD